VILEIKDKKIISDTRMEKSREFLSDARATYDDKRYRTSVNRAYYAALNAVRAILILEGANPETHDGAVTLLSLRFVKTGVLPVDVIKKFKVLLSRRTDVDYGDFDTTGATEAEDSLRSAEAVIEVIDRARQKIIIDLDGLS
jgi:uncharacterized protein (UPF0332 family)